MSFGFLLQEHKS